MIAVALALRLQPFWASGHNTLFMLVESSVVAGVGAIGIWQFSFSAAERESHGAKIRRKLGGKVKDVPA